MNISSSLVTVAVALLGLVLSFYIWNSKRKNRPLICPLKSDCDAVVKSDFSRLFGIPLEILGMIYYALTALGYAIFSFYPLWKTPLPTFIFLVITTIAFLFSIYLTSVQAFAIRQWCVWCLASASFCAILFATTIIGNDLSFTDMLIRYYDFLVAGLTVGLTLGVGAVTVYNVVYIKFLRDLKISPAEQDTLKTIGQIVWIALIIIIFSAFSLYLSAPEIHNTSPTFILKIIVLGVILLSDAMMNILIAPQLIDISVGKRPEHTAGEFRALRRFSFALSASSLISWYSLLTLLVLPLTIPATLGKLIIYYLIALASGIILSQLVNYSLQQK